MALQSVHVVKWSRKKAWLHYLISTYLGFPGTVRKVSHIAVPSALSHSMSRGGVSGSQCKLCWNPSTLFPSAVSQSLGWLSSGFFALLLCSVWISSTERWKAHQRHLQPAPFQCASLPFLPPKVTLSYADASFHMVNILIWSRESFQRMREPLKEKIIHVIAVHYLSAGGGRYLLAWLCCHCERPRGSFSHLVDALEWLLGAPLKGGLEARLHCDRL